MSPETATPEAGAPGLSWQETAGARWAFTRRAEGNLALHVGDEPGDVLLRRARLAESAGCPGFRFMDQTHSDVVVGVEGEAPQISPETGTPRDPVSADAMTSSTTPLGVLVADCLPVLFIAVGPQGRAVRVAAAHAGRAGVLNGILGKTAGALRKAEPDARIQAVIGPAVCAACYEVPEDMAAEAELAEPGIRALTRWGTPSLDLKGAARRQLARLGVEVSDLGLCTVESEEHSSHRRDPGSGRIAGLIVPPASAPGSARASAPGGQDGDDDGGDSPAETRTGERA